MPSNRVDRERTSERCGAPHTGETHRVEPAGRARSGMDGHVALDCVTLVITIPARGRVRGPRAAVGRTPVSSPDVCTSRDAAGPVAQAAQAGPCLHRPERETPRVDRSQHPRAASEEPSLVDGTAHRACRAPLRARAFRRTGPQRPREARAHSHGQRRSRTRGATMACPAAG